MTDRRLVQYWDSVLFISYLSGTIPERVSLIKVLLAHVQSKKIAVVTSTFTLAEVRYFRPASSSGQVNDSGREQEIADLFTSPLIEFRAVTDFIGRRAYEIGRDHNQLSPADCVHIATAEDIPADVLLTWDGSGVKGRRAPEKMLAYDGKIGAPPLAIQEPADPWPGLLVIEDPGRLAPLAENPNAPQARAARSPDTSPE